MQSGPLEIIKLPSVLDIVKEVKNRKGRKREMKQRKKDAIAYVFLIPLLVLFAVFLGYSFYFLIKESFYKVNISFREPEFFGLRNYKNVISDKQFWRSLLNTFLLSSANIFFGLTVGYLIAVFLKLKIKGRRFFHAVFFIPSMLPIALMAAIFNSMLQYKEGVINQILRAVGLGGLAQRWLANPDLAMMSVMSVSFFLIGIPIMYYTADLTTIDASVMEAAVVDGAKLRHVVTMILYPMLKSTHKTIILSMMLGGFREMDRVFLMTDGGPGGVTEITGTYIYRASRAPGANIGKVCAASVLVLLLSFVVGAVQLQMTKKKNKG